MSDTEYRLPPGCTGPHEETGMIRVGDRWKVRRASGPLRLAGSSDESAEDAVAQAWRQWERLAGMTRADYEQREKALELVRRIAGRDIEAEVGPQDTLGSLAVRWHDEADAIIAALEGGDPNE